jgi:galacturan 1,4-alpha-galacturonidase
VAFRSARFIYIDVTGTGTKSKEVVTMVCSDVCEDITATGTDLKGTSGELEYYCAKIASLSSLDFPCFKGGSTVLRASFILETDLNVVSR